MSYHIKIMLAITLLVAVAFGAGGTMMIVTAFQTSLKHEMKASLESFESVQNTLYLLSSLGDQTNYESLADALQQMEEQNLEKWEALSLQADGSVVFFSGNREYLDYEISIPEADQCSYLPVSDEGGPGLVILSRIEAGDAELELRVRFDLSQVYQTREDQQRIYLVIYVVVVLVGIAASFAMSSALTKDLRKLTRTVRYISAGDLTKRSRITSQDEVGQLSHDFDKMADCLQENINRLETEVQRQESFMGAFAHELKTPMTSIIGFSDLLRQGDLDENTRMMAADYIFSEGHRLERLSLKLLDLLILKKEEIQRKTVRLSTYLGEIERALGPVMRERGVRLVCKAGAGQATVEPDLVKSLLYNLIDNASKAMEDGGLVAVIATAAPGSCQFQVVDNGRGMAPEELSRITEAFYRVDKARSRSQGGAGLGLALCKQIVELHNGEIHFESRPGAGTRVTVILHEEGEDDEKV